jgi:DNA-binding transcriptional LysR family regulator
VRLTTATHVSAGLLAPALPALRARHPGILLEVATDARNFDSRAARPTSRCGSAAPATRGW